MALNTYFFVQTLPALAFVALTSVFLIHSFINWAHNFGLLDKPDNHTKQHRGTIPLIGGITIFLSVTIGALIFLQLPEQFISIAIICGLVTLVGVLDDKFPLHPLYRLIFQLLAGTAIAGISFVQLENLGNLFGFGYVYLGVLTIPFTAIGVTALCNAYNMTDGIDGLAATHGLITIAAIIVLIWNKVPADEVTLLMFIIVSLVTFLSFNLRLFPQTKTKIFMGDAGSMLIGMAIAIALVYYSQRDDHLFCAATALWLVALPLMDMVSTMLRRILKGKSPFYGDRSHLHHILIRSGMSHQQVLRSITAASAVCACIGIVFEKTLEADLQWVSFYSFVAVFGLYFNFVIKHAWKFSHRLKQAL